MSNRRKTLSPVIQPYALSSRGAMSGRTGSHPYFKCNLKNTCILIVSDESLAKGIKTAEMASRICLNANEPLLRAKTSFEPC